MRIDQIGGEFSLIDRLARIAPAEQGDLLVGIGDDAAAMSVPGDPERLLLTTTDTLVENVHFRRDWSTPDQIGRKAVECNVSDIAAMGGSPTVMFVSLVLPETVIVEWICDLYQGMAAACREYGITVAGGDTTRGGQVVIGITLMGRVPRSRLCRRGDGREGDLLAVTGTLGASAAGMALLEAGLHPSAYLRDKHLSPRCRLDAGKTLSPLVNAMIDISDGLASETHHICRCSKLGAVLFEKKIPLHRDVMTAAHTLNRPAVDFAINGGEDYELLFSIAPERLEALAECGVGHHIVGRLCSADEGVRIEDANGRRPLSGGYDHFR